MYLSKILKGFLSKTFLADYEIALTTKVFVKKKGKKKKKRNFITLQIFNVLPLRLLYVSPT